MSDDTLLGRSLGKNDNAGAGGGGGARFVAYEVAEREGEMTPRGMDRAWMKGRKGTGKDNGVMKDEIELQEREVERGS